MFRRLFGGKVAPVGEQPESILYFYLTTPRVAAPRWYHEGVATFVDTWMAGGLGRGQGGYDEMVFRSMVKDGSRFYDPLGLVSEGTKIDFQLQVNSYLYGTRFMTWLARTYSPEQVIAWMRRHDGSRGYYAAQFRQRVRPLARRRLGQWIEGRAARSRRRIWRRCGNIRSRRTSDLTSRALGSISRAYFDATSGRSTPPQLSGHRRAPWRDLGADRRRAAAGRHQRPDNLYRHVAGPRSGSGTIFYTIDNGAYRDLVQLDPPTGHRAPAERRSDRRLGLQSRAPIAVGDPAAERTVHARPDRRRPTATGRRSTPSPTARSSTTSTCRRTARGSSPRSARSTENRTCACCRSRAPARRFHPGGAVRFRDGRPEQLRVLARWPVSLRQLVLHRRVEHLSLRDRGEEARRRQQHRYRLLPSDSARRRRADRVQLHRRGIRTGRG